MKTSLHHTQACINLHCEYDLKWEKYESEILRHLINLLMGQCILYVNEVEGID